MYICYNNKLALNDIYVHDCKFDGFLYEYETRTVSFQCKNKFYNINHSFTFHNVILLNMQSCLFWGRGCNILWMETVDSSEEVDALYKVQQENARLYDHSALSTDIRYVIVRIKLNSGDELLIACESIEHRED